jgi:Holliday junction resolvase
MGMKSRRKGRRAEQEIVRLARQNGLDATRTWHTAQAANPHVRRCDVTIAGRTAQVRVRGNGYKAVYDALEEVEIAFLRADGRPWLAVLPAERLLALLAQVRDGKGP